MFAFLDVTMVRPGGYLRMHICGVNARPLNGGIVEQNAVVVRIGWNVGRCCDVYTTAVLCSAVEHGKRQGHLSQKMEAALRG